jgi:glyoxylase-like metal-dependent hydrolase (beta-lactamase superfamily II)
VRVDGPLDLQHLGRDRVIGAYLVATDDGPALFDCGPTTCLEALQERLAEHGLRLTDLRHLLLSHIHLDHAGAAGVLVREQPALRVHVSAVGAPHLADPSRLEASARRLYGDDFDRLWGELVAVPEENIQPTAGTVVGLDCFPTPGHASHHVAYLTPDGTLLAGDATGVRIQPSDVVLPPTPPPDVDVARWHKTIEEIAHRDPERLALVHFGVADDIGRHLNELTRTLDAWAERVDSGASEEEFVRSAAEAIPPPERAAYEQAMPLDQSYAGLERWARKRREAAQA